MIVIRESNSWLNTNKLSKKSINGIQANIRGKVIKEVKYILHRDWININITLNNNNDDFTTESIPNHWNKTSGIQFYQVEWKCSLYIKSMFDRGAWKIFWKL